jgi:hypothetical protein
MHSNINVSKKPDIKFDISINGKLVKSSVTEEWLPIYLNGYLTEGKRDEVLRRLKIEGNATAEIPFGKFEQI